MDGLSQHRKLGPPEAMPDPDRRFVVSKHFDYADGWYRRAYSPRNAALWGAKSRHLQADRDAAVTDVQHQRCIFYRKGQYAIICDRIVGKGEHQLDIIFRPAPVIQGKGIQRTARAVQLSIKSDGSVVTKEPEHANVAILPVQGNNLEVLDLVGQKNPVRGWFALFAIKAVPSARQWSTDSS